MPLPIAPASSLPTSGRQPRRTQRRLLLLYVCAIVGPTLALLYLGLVSVRRQGEAIATLTNATARLRLERVADALEGRVLDLARACLMDGGVAAAVSATDWSSPESVHVTRARLDVVCDAHALCADLVVVRRDDTGTPLLDEPLPRAPADLVAGLPDSGDRHGLGTLAAAVRAEEDGRQAAALRSFEALAVGGADPRLRAIALAREARLHAARGDRPRAAEAWRRLAAEHPDAYDLVHRPQAVVAALELVRLTGLRGGEGEEPEPLLDEIRRSLAAGRWQVSPGQAEYFVAQLDAHMSQPGQDTPVRPAAESWAASRLFQQFAVASQVRAHLSNGGAPATGQVQTLAFTQDGRPHQVFLATLPDGAGGAAIVALDADLSWVRGELVTTMHEGTGSASQVSAPQIVGASASASVFRRVFPFWSLAPAVGHAGARPRWSSEVLAFGGAIAGVLSVLVLGVVLLLRDVARDASTARLQSDLVSGVSHELKTPLSVIRLYAESLADDFGAAGDVRAAHSRVILHESERLSHLVERVLEFSRHESALPTFELEFHDPAALVAAFIDRYTPYVVHLGFTIERELDPAAPTVRVDSSAMTQALVNLVDNAVKYSGDSRDLVLRVRTRDESVLIEVEDHGIGIPPGDRARLFEAFQRGARTDGRGGYGLGLYLVARIMQAHGGSIEVDTMPAGGTCMRLVLPAHADRTES